MANMQKHHNHSFDAIIFLFRISLWSWCETNWIAWLSVLYPTRLHRFVNKSKRYCDASECHPYHWETLLISSSIWLACCVAEPAAMDKMHSAHWRNFWCTHAKFNWQLIERTHYNFYPFGCVWCVCVCVWLRCCHWELKKQIICHPHHLPLAHPHSHITLNGCKQIRNAWSRLNSRGW